MLKLFICLKVRLLKSYVLKPQRPFIDQVLNKKIINKKIRGGQFNFLQKVECKQLKENYIVYLYWFSQSNILLQAKILQARKIKMRKKTTEKQTSRKQEKIIHKGIYISNQRRKGPGGRIKCDTFQGKIEVSDFNPAIHESQIQWVQIRRYIRGDKRTPNKRNNRQEKAPIKKYQKQAPSYSKNGQKDQKQTNLFKKFKQKIVSQTSVTIEEKKIQKVTQTQKQPHSSALEDKGKMNESDLEDIKPLQAKEETKANEAKDQIRKRGEQKIGDNQTAEQRNIDEVQTQSDNDSDGQNIESSSKSSKKQTTIEQKSQKIIVVTKAQSGQDNKKDEEQKKQVQEIIVARIVKETKIVFKQKKFVAILTCQKRKNVKNTFVQKDIKPIEKIIHDYFLDVAPIHSRLPKMDLDNLVEQNIKVLTDYIEKIHPQKGKQLTNKKLNQILDVIQSIYVVASFGVWDNNRPYANIHQVIGKTMTIDGECNCFLFEHHLNDFQYETSQAGNEEPKKIELCPTQHHKKFDKMIFSIDPASSIDLDDALSIQKVGQTTYQIGIHISDVSQYLKYIERSELMKRTTSVYLPHKVFHMLTNQVMKISSLNPNVQRLAFSIYVKMNQEGNIVEESRLQKNIIKSRFKLSYETVQDIITAKINFDGFLKKHPYTSLQDFQTLVAKLQDLTRLGLAHRQKRIKFQVFQNTEIHFQLDENKWPIDISVSSRFTSKKIVQEFMIIGNVEAAKHLIKNFKQNALIIYHPKPSELAVKSFNQTFKFMDMKFQFEDIQQVQQKFMDIENDNTIPQQVKQFFYFRGRRVQETAGYKLYHQAVKQILQKSQNKDEALIRNVHFALGQDFYTHFTSPMRRMADVLVHETLNSLIYKTLPKKISEDQIQKINLGRRHTKRLKRDLTQMYMCLMIYKTGKKIQEDGVITSFGLKSVSIYIPYFDMLKQIIWRDELQLHRVSKNRQDQEILDVCIYYDRDFPSRDIMWKVKKFQKVKLTIDCTKRPPLRLSISLQIQSTKGRKQIIHAYSDI